ncbi:MBL fold metallo-hydrolase [Virgibacillus pantothenticus]|uniref:Lactamase n=1 Tax=Virgibacillus pantothenticus TaxID=1473 RepID=A0A0L0QW10_VIRPA|nr:MULTISPECIES: MBL fold metallo-hydrolase [Virgibacillus]API92617.1 MBL fold metallo-hydrolase [Virgibacillus sp. 6R]KNE22393.1 lactamase [Virgibacillus pantothenticus]MBS7428108.1 MBL fold metallo-hydrolase [Virgibacillus sp. 19R1-5]MED3738367.1 MBL fold metallo-hydrolase [Virgibacillus pantothenticus]QTY16849.1 MBL fold metallo-hydrolase [Virgibacillus pantothenticus]
MLQDAWFTVQQINDDTFAISEYGHWEKVHSFLLIGEDKAALIDTGLGIDSMKRITDQLTTKPIEVITTHVHVDHIGSHGEYDTIHVHERDQDWLIHGIEGLTLQQIRKDIARDITLPTPATFNPKTYMPFQGIPTNILKDGDIIELGNRQLTIYHTPGHSPGHIAVFDEKQGYLFTGDLLYDQTPIYAFYPSANPVDLVSSLEKISNIDGVKKVFGSHNTLGLDVSILQEVKQAVTYLQKHDLVKFGTGVHEFNGFCIQF